MAGSKNRGGRPSSLTPDVHRLIVKMLASGNYVETAAAAAGVDRMTIRAWLKRGAREKVGRYAKFSRDVGKALGEAEASLLALIATAAYGSKQWQAAAWILERKFPQRYGRRIQVEEAAERSTDNAIMEKIAEDFADRSTDELEHYAQHGHFPPPATELH